jgi:acyl-CoA synthetase (AMP-forming)/AMP-acid ligase II
VNNVFSVAFVNLCQVGAMARIKAEKGGADESTEAASPGPLSFLLCTPLFHVTGNNCVAQIASLSGGKLVHMYRWDAGEALKIIEREKITNISGVPVMSRELIAHPDFPRTDTSTLKFLGGGGAPLQPDLVDRIEKAVETAQPQTGYGMTETCGIIAAVGGEFFLDKPESTGPAMPVFDTKCIDSDGKDVPQGEVGELCVKSSQVIRGYLNRPEATAEAIQDGWLRTGDIARIDQDGFIFIVDRAKDMLIRGGENVYCAEVEAAIFDHDAVAECAVFGVEDDRLGEEVGAAVFLARGRTVSAEELRAHCADRLARYKVPRYIWMRSEALPRNASGKFLKRQLREELDVADAD